MNYNKDSFDRYGDDLCELLLSYLSIDEKLKFECVSKQWKRLIFNKHFNLIICTKTTRIDWSRINNILLTATNGEIHSQSEISCIIDLTDKEWIANIQLCSLEMVLKKFKFIKQIVFSSRVGIVITGQVIELITNNCNALEKFIIFKGCFEFLSEKQIQEFGQKFGTSLRDVRIHLINGHNSKIVEKLFDFVPNVKNIYFKNISVITLKPNKFYSKLEEVISRNISFEDFEKLANLIQLSRFENLETLIFSICTNGSIDDSLEMIANKCNHLKHLELTLFPLPDYDINIINGQIFTILAKFRSLNCLKISLSLIGKDEKKLFNYVKSHYGSIESLKICKELEHLSVSAPNLSDDHFKDLSLHLPQLKSIQISSNSEITDQTLKHLSKMQNLSRVVVKDIDRHKFDTEDHFNITDQSVCRLLNGCPHIKTVKFKCFTKLTQTSIDAFIEMAKRNPKVDYDFFFNSINKMDCNDNSDGEEDDFEVPDNLSLEYKAL